MLSSKNGKNTSDRPSKTYFTSMTCTNFYTQQNIMFAPLQKCKNDPKSIVNSPLNLCKFVSDNSSAYNSDPESSKRNKLKLKFFNEQKETFERKKKRIKSVKMVLSKKNEESKESNPSPKGCKYTVEKTNYFFNKNYEEIIKNKNENNTTKNKNEIKKNLKVVNFNVDFQLSSPIFNCLSQNSKNVELVIDIDNYSDYNYIFYSNQI